MWPSPPGGTWGQGQSSGKGRLFLWQPEQTGQTDRKAEAGEAGQEEDVIAGLRWPASGRQGDQETQKLWGLLVRAPACQRSPQGPRLPKEPTVRSRFLSQCVGMGSAFVLPVMPGAASGTVTGALRVNASIQLPRGPQNLPGVRAGAGYICSLAGHNSKWKRYFPSNRAPLPHLYPGTGPVGVITKWNGNLQPHACCKRATPFFCFLNYLGSAIREGVSTVWIFLVSSSSLFRSALGWDDLLLTQLSSAMSHAFNTAETLHRARMGDGCLIPL